MFELAATNLLAPPALFFALGLFAAWVRSDLSMPEAAAKLLSLYLLLSIGFKGGVAAHSAGLSLEIIGALAVGFAMSALMPVLIFPIFKKLAGLDGVTAAATAAHYGSISIVTFVAASDFAQRAEIAGKPRDPDRLGAGKSVSGQKPVSGVRSSKCIGPRRWHRHSTF
jgi:uncharacterized protein